MFLCHLTAFGGDPEVFIRSLSTEKLKQKNDTGFPLKNCGNDGRRKSDHPTANRYGEVPVKREIVADAAFLTSTSCAFFSRSRNK